MGTHSARCLVAETQPDGKYRLLDDIRVPTGLGKDLALSKNISPAAEIQRAFGVDVEIISGKTIAELRDTTGVPYDRAEIVPAGACAAVEVIRFLGAKRMVICDRGLRGGLLLRLIRKTFR